LTDFTGSLSNLEKEEDERNLKLDEFII